MYRSRYWRAEYFAASVKMDEVSSTRVSRYSLTALDLIALPFFSNQASKMASISMPTLVFRWIEHHSSLDPTLGDRVVSCFLPFTRSFCFRSDLLSFSVLSSSSVRRASSSSKGTWPLSNRDRSTRPSSRSEFCLFSQKPFGPFEAAAQNHPDQPQNRRSWGAREGSSASLLLVDD